MPLKLIINEGILDACCDEKPTESIGHTPDNAHDSRCKPAFDWSNTNLYAYYELTRIELFNLCSLFMEHDLEILKSMRPDIFSQKGINDIYNNIVNVLSMAAIRTVKVKN